MGRAKRGKNKLPGFVALPWDVLNSPAFKSMSATSRAALPYFLGKPKHPFNRAEYFTSEFNFSYPEAGSYGFARGTFSRILRQIIAHGFIDPVDKGGLRGLGKTSSVFKLSRRWEKFGTQEFQHISWANFQP